jgi:hypothetical protein
VDGAHNGAPILMSHIGQDASNLVCGVGVLRGYRGTPYGRVGRTCRVWNAAQVTALYAVTSSLLCKHMTFSIELHLSPDYH